MRGEGTWPQPLGSCLTPSNLISLLEMAEIITMIFKNPSYCPVPKVINVL